MKLIYFFLTILIVISNLACMNPFSSEKKYASDEERLFDYIKNNDVKKIKRIINEVDINKPALGYSVSLFGYNNIPTGSPSKGHIISLFGWRRYPYYPGREFHKGIDIEVPVKTKIKATADGIITTVGWKRETGFTIIIKHEYNQETLYGFCLVEQAEQPLKNVHRFSIKTQVGEQVKKGDVIAVAGFTNNNKKNMIHYEIIKHGIPKNPFPSFKLKADSPVKTFPLHYAISLGFYEIAQLLIKHGAEINRNDRIGLKPEEIADFIKRSDLKELLLQKI